MLLKRAGHLTQNLTSYDFLKCITVLLMFADHIGVINRYLEIKARGQL